MKKILSLIVVLALSAALLVGCGVRAQKDAAMQTHTTTLSQKDSPMPPAGGVLFLKVNPELALHYDENGKVTKVEGRNPDGVKLLEDFTGYAGKDTALVLETLVERIGEAGYFVEEADGTARKIVLELDPGSQVPNEQFLQDMADHVKSCVESKNWIGEKEYEYPQHSRQNRNEPVLTEPKPVPTEQKVAPVEPKPSKPVITLCEICGDDDCDDGVYCDDADELAENLWEAENRKNNTPCEICGDYDCDDGIYCDDAHEKRENLAEEKKPTPTEPKISASLCEICGDDDCDDGIYCDDADELEENLREAENRKNGPPCEICGDYDCDDGPYCDDHWDDDDDEHHDHHGRHHKD